MFFFAGKELVDFGDFSAPVIGAYMTSTPDSGISMTLWHKYLYFSDLSTTFGQVLCFALSPDEKHLGVLIESAPSFALLQPSLYITLMRSIDG